ncbi:hypothetical protein BJF78_02285 [Pseudonocardia sp. CNS-139]|nr:hypothetical protein BJF78_02285 [Pseudonocardia sp. CNS-139]
MTGTDRVAWCAPASYLQEQWYRSVEDRRSNYNVVVAWRLLGALDTGALRQALRALVDRHEILRTGLADRDDGVEQRILAHTEPPLRQIDLGSARDPAAEMRRLIATDAAHPFALREPPLWRALLARVGPDEHVLALVLHHAVCDGWSSMVLERDLAALYRATVTGRAPVLPAVPLQFGDFAAWERAHRDVWREQEWRARLGPAAGSAVPALRDLLPFELVCHPVAAVSPAAADRLSALARQHGATLATLLYAAALMTLAPALGEEVVVGIAHANRDDREVQPVVGPVFDYLPVRVALDGCPALVPLMGRIRREEQAARSRLLPLGLVEQAVGAGPHGALFDVVLNFAPAGRTPAPAGPVAFTPFPVATDRTRVRVERDFSGAGPLSFVLRRGADGGLGGHLYGHAGALGRPGLARLGRHFAATLDRLGRDPGYRGPALDLRP